MGEEIIAKGKNKSESFSYGYALLFIFGFSMLLVGSLVIFLIGLLKGKKEAKYRILMKFSILFL